MSPPTYITSFTNHDTHRRRGGPDESSQVCVEEHTEAWTSTRTSKQSLQIMADHSVHDGAAIISHDSG